MNILDKTFLVFLILISLIGHCRLFMEGCKNGKRTGGTGMVSPRAQLSPTAVPRVPKVQLAKKTLVPFYQYNVFVKFVDLDNK